MQEQPDQLPSSSSTPPEQKSLEKRTFKKKYILGGVVLIVLLSGIIIFQRFESLQKKPVVGPSVAQLPTTMVSPSLAPGMPEYLLPATIKNPVHGSIAFIKEGDIWKINADRSDLIQLTKNEHNAFHLNVSPDGTAIAYAFYPKDEIKRTNQGYYVGYNSGLAFVTVTTRQITELIPYGNIQNHYPVWSPDGSYISIWQGNGVAARVFSIHDNKEVLSVTGTNVTPVSPVVWVPKSTKVSYIANDNLIVSQLDGSDKKILASGVDALRQVHESPNIPQPPFWSTSGRYVAFYKQGDFHVTDVINGTDALVGAKSPDEMFGPYPQVFLSAYGKDERQLYLLDYSQQESNTVIYDLATGQSDRVASFGQSLTTSPNKDVLFGVISDGVWFFSLANKQKKQCGSHIDYSYYTWAGGFSFDFNQAIWSPDGKGILGAENGIEGTVIKVLNTDTCEVYDLFRGENVQPATWFP